MMQFKFHNIIFIHPGTVSWLITSFSKNCNQYHRLYDQRISKTKYNSLFLSTPPPLSLIYWCLKHVHWNDKALNIEYNEKQRSCERMKRAYVSPSRTVCKSSSPFSNRENFTSIPSARFYFYTHGDQAVRCIKRQRFRE